MMRQVIIENPVLNSPFEEPKRHFILEVTGEEKRGKEAKVSTARTLWVPAVNNHGGFGRWAFIEITDPWDAKNAIRKALQSLNA